MEPETPEEPIFLDGNGKEAKPKRSRERFRPGIAERERKRKAIFGVVLLVVASVVFAGVFFVVSVYEKPADTLPVEIPVGDRVEFLDWQARSKQKWEKVNRGGRIYRDKWVVHASGVVKNLTGETLFLNGLEVEVVNKSDRVIHRRLVHMEPLKPGESKTVSIRGSCEDLGRPAGLRVQVASSPVTKNISDLADEIERIQERFDH